MSNHGNGSGSIFKRGDIGPWYISWYDAVGKRKSHCTKTTDKATAQRILAKTLADVALRRDGVIDARQESVVIESAKPIETHLADFVGMMNARQRSDRHIKSTLFLIRQVCKAAGFDKVSDITADGLNRITADLKAEGKSTRTAQARVVAMKAFTRWLADHGKLSHDPLRSVKRPSVKTDRRLRRRMLLPTEWPCLRAATLASGPRNGMNPLERVALYAVAIQTGLRSAEVRSVTKADLFLAGEKPYIRCKAEDTKNGQEARQYIHADLAEELRWLVANKTPTANVFPMPDEFHVAEMLRGDLAAARKQWIEELRHDPDAHANREESDFLAVANHQGEELDFHALRHTTGSWLALQGVHPNIVKTVMRHSTITLTMDTYGHLLPDQHAEAVGGMASMMTTKSPLAATGTAGIATAPGAAPAAPNYAKECDSVQAGDESADRRQTLEFPRKSEDDKEEIKSASCRARTYDPLIKSRRSGFATEAVCLDGA
jgi:integrase